MEKIVFLFLVVSYNCFGQKQVSYVNFASANSNPAIAVLQGTWKIDQLLLNDKVKEYVLYPQKPESNGYSYGNHLSLNSNGTFAGGYSAPCGNDCFTTSTGQYKMLTEDYIAFYLEKVTRSGDCSGNSTPNLDLGVYRIYREANKILLRKSNGDPLQDQKNITYIDKLTAKSKDLAAYFNLQSFLKWSTIKQPKDAHEMAAFCMTQNQITEYEILYDGTYNNINLILVKIQNKDRYIVYEGDHRLGIKVALVTDTFFEETDWWAKQIEGDKGMKVTTINDVYDYWRNPLTKNTVVVYKKNNAIQKIIYNHYNRESKYYKEIYYFKNNQLNLIKIEPPTGIPFSYYVFDEQNMNGAVMKPMVENWSFSGVMQYFYQLMPLVEKAK